MDAVQTSPSNDFFVGEEFSSYAELAEKIKVYSAKKFISLYVRTSRSIKSAVGSRRIKLENWENLEHQLKYYEVEYDCIHGGKKYTSRSKGKRSCR